MQDKENPQSKKKQSLANYSKYSAIAFQMGAIIGVGVFCGIKLDEYFGLKKFPLFTLLLSFSSVVLSVYYMIKDLMRK
ncbi:MAG: AtpZ/AtpI family protein [Bacteroidota bacterium]